MLRRSAIAVLRSKCNEERFETMEGLRKAYPQEPRKLFDLAVGLLGYYLDRRAGFARPVEVAKPPLWTLPDEEREEAPITLAEES